MKLGSTLGRISAQGPNEHRFGGRVTRSEPHWASKGVFGERIWAERNKVELPDQFKSAAVENATYMFQLVGTMVLAHGLIQLDLLAVVSGIVIVQCAKAWFIDRMVLLSKT